MKTVGKQLQEARLAKNWTPELAARETKIKVDRLKDLESDDYSHFNNATYARGFVRTYARALGLDEYKILRQLDNKLPDDDTANIVTAEGGVAYLPETAMPPRVAHRDFTGLYVVMGLTAAIMLVIVFVLFRAYQVGELGRWTGEDTASSTPATTNGAPTAGGVATEDATPRAKPIDSDTPPPIPAPAEAAAVAADPASAAATDTTTTAAPKALPVDLNAPDAPLAPGVASSNATPAAPKALPVDPSTLTAANSPPQTAAPNATPAADTATPTPRALPVDPSTLNTPPATAPAPVATPAPVDIPTTAPRALPVDPSALNAPSASTPSADDSTANAPKALPVNPADLAAGAGGTATADGGATGGEAKPLVLTASRDSFVKVTMLDPDASDKPVYAAVLHSGQSVGFDGHKFSVDVDNPSAVNIKLDGVNYPHDDGKDPETFTVVSHVQ